MNEDKPLMGDMDKNKDMENDPDADWKPDNFYGHKTNGEDSGARDENIFESLCCCICPKISITQFVVIISLIEIVVFIITISVYGLSN